MAFVKSLTLTLIFFRIRNHFLPVFRETFTKAYNISFLPLTNILARVIPLFSENSLLLSPVRGRRGIITSYALDMFYPNSHFTLLKWVLFARNYDYIIFANNILKNNFYKFNSLKLLGLSPLVRVAESGLCLSRIFGISRLSLAITSASYFLWIGLSHTLFSLALCSFLARQSFSVGGSIGGLFLWPLPL